MVTFNETIVRSLTKSFEKKDIEGVVVNGSATYNKDNALTDANAAVYAGEDFIGRMYYYGESVRIEECKMENLAKVAEVVDATIADLRASYPAE